MQSEEITHQKHFHAGQLFLDTATTHFTDKPLETTASQANARADTTEDGYQALKNIDRSKIQCWRTMDPTYQLIDLAVYGSAEADIVLRAAEELAISEHVPTIPVALTFGRGDHQKQPTMNQKLQNQQHSLDHRTQNVSRSQHLNRQHCQLQPSNEDYICGLHPHTIMLSQQPVQQMSTTNAIQVVTNMGQVWLLPTPLGYNDPGGNWYCNYNVNFPPLLNSIP